MDVCGQQRQPRDRRAICLAGTLDLSCVIGTIRVNGNAKHLYRSGVCREVMLSDCACVELLLL